MASSITLRSLRLLRLPKSTVIPGTSSRRYYGTIVSSYGHRHTADASSCCIAEFQGPVGRFVVNPLRTALYYFMDTIYPYTPTKNLRWSLNTTNHLQSPACGRSLLAYIKSSLLGSGLDVTEIAKTLRIFQGMRGLEQDVKVWVKAGTKFTKFGEVWVENGNFVSKEGPKVFGHLLDCRNVYGTESLWTVFLNPSVTPLMKPEESKRYEGKDCGEPNTPRNGPPGDVYKIIFAICLIAIGTGIAGCATYIHVKSFWVNQARIDEIINLNNENKNVELYCKKISVGPHETTMAFAELSKEAPVANLKKLREENDISEKRTVC